VSDLERFWLGDDEYGDPALVPASDGDWVRFSDAAEREARLNAHCARLTDSLQGMMELNARLEAQVERLDAECNRRANDVDQMTAEIKTFLDARWRERIEAAIEREELTGTRERVELLRSLLDSGEEQVCPMCRDLENVEYSSGSIGPCPTCRATPSPAFHREGREQFCPEKTQKNWTTDGRSAPVAVPEKVEVMARAIGEVGGIEWDNLNSVNKALARSQARAALHALQEGTE
jgi:rubrerythrin